MCLPSLLPELLSALFVLLRRSLTLMSLVSKSHLPQWGAIASAERGLLVTITVKLIVLLRHTGSVLAVATWLIVLIIKLDLI